GGRGRHGGAAGGAAASALVAGGNGRAGPAGRPGGARRPGWGGQVRDRQPGRRDRLRPGRRGGGQHRRGSVRARRGAPGRHGRADRAAAARCDRRGAGRRRRQQRPDHPRQLFLHLGRLAGGGHAAQRGPARSRLPGDPPVPAHRMAGGAGHPARRGEPTRQGDADHRQHVVKRRTFQPASSGSAPPPAAGWSQHIVLRVLLIAFVVLFLAEFLPAPWAFHIGGRFTPLGQWDGYGPVQASDGGRYLLFTHLQGGVIAHGGRPGCAFHGGCNSLRGSAKLCTESGRVYSFSLSGKLHGWLTTDGSPTSISLSGGSLTTDGSSTTISLSGSSP